jgi:hypothetical protein
VKLILGVICLGLSVLASGCSASPAYCDDLERYLGDANRSTNQLALTLAEAHSWDIFIAHNSRAALSISSAAKYRRVRGPEHILTKTSLQVANENFAAECVK